MGAGRWVTPLDPAERRSAPRGPLPAAAQSATSSREAPVAQLDRALPSEGKGHTFESCRVRHLFLYLTTRSARPIPELQCCPIQAIRRKSSPNADSLATRLTLKAFVRGDAVPRRRDENPRDGPFLQADEIETTNDCSAECASMSGLADGSMWRYRLANWLLPSNSFAERALFNDRESE